MFLYISSFNYCFLFLIFILAKENISDQHIYKKLSEEYLQRFFYNQFYYYIKYKNMENANWMPLQSNPEVMNNFLQKLGLRTQEYAIYDLLSIQDWAQDMVPKPVLGVVFLFQESQAQIHYANFEKQTLSAQNNSNKLFYMKQYAKNACGTIALFHVIFNSLEKYPDLIKQASKLDQFRSLIQNKTPEERGQLFKTNNSLLTQHKQAASTGQTSSSETSNSHFIAFIQKQGHLYQLDGCKKMAVNHGVCSSQNILGESCRVIGQFMQRDSNNVNFSIVVLSKKGQQQM